MNLEYLLTTLKGWAVAGIAQVVQGTGLGVRGCLHLRKVLPGLRWVSCVSFLRHTHWLYHLGRPAGASVQTLLCKIRALQTRVMQISTMQIRVRQIRTILVKIQSWPMDPVKSVPQLLSVRDVKVREMA